jgi:hypothetical protein
MKNPSDFVEWPWSSIFRNSEHEQVATNIMVILKRTGNKWRELSWDEYLAERQKDGGGNTGNYSTSHGYLSEQTCFSSVQPYTVSPEKAAEFSGTWAKIFKS